MFIGFGRNIVIPKKNVKSFILQILQTNQERKLLHIKYYYKMHEAFVRYNKSDERFCISFHYVNEIIDKQFNFNRLINEPIENFLKRVDLNVSKMIYDKKNRKAKKDKNKESHKNAEIVDNVKLEKIKFLKNNEKVSNSTLCKDILEESSDVVLEILGTKYVLNVNSPWITNIHLPSSMMVGFPTYPIKLESFNMRIEDSIFTWYKGKRNDVLHKPDLCIELGKGYFYIPTNEDIGFKLKVVCEPRFQDRSGPLAEVISSCKVEAGPGVCPFELRHAFTKEKLSGKNFRFMSYNLLADTYADSNYSRETLFPYCPEYALEIDYRKQLFIKEIIGFNSDIICLQEVDNKIFENDLKPILTTINYEGTFAKKGHELSEGLALFYNADRLQLLHSDIAVISKNIDLKRFSDVWNRLTNEKTKERFLGRNTTIQVAVLKSVENPDIFVVGNTHLYFHPDADHIRLLQGYYTLTYMQDTVKTFQEENPYAKVHMIICGDFNSTPDSGVYQFFIQNHVPEDFEGWSSNEEEKVENISLSHDMSIASACGTPEYTNYTVDFKGCLDYIFYNTKGMKVTQVVPMPSDEQVKLHKAIPSVVFPSDHISICADLEIIS